MSRQCDCKNFFEPILPDQEASGGYQTLSMSDVGTLADPINAPALSQVAVGVGVEERKPARKEERQGRPPRAP